MRQNVIKTGIEGMTLIILFGKIFLRRRSRRKGTWCCSNM